VRGDRITKVSSTSSPELPLTAEDVKDFLKVEDDLDDALIAGFMQTALYWAEERTNRAISRRSYLVVRDSFPIGPWTLPLGRVESITTIQYIDTSGVTQTWAPSPTEWQLDNDSDYQARLDLKPGFSWPSTGEYLSVARIELIAGWIAAAVPFTLKQAMLLKIAGMYETRGPGDPESTSVDDAAEVLLSGWKLPGF
jgi:uncharacterized phiE125 gp8 family phage protein